jgi:hypothetical protein
MKEGIFDGQEISQLRTHSNQWGQREDLIVELDNGEICKMKVEEFHKVLSFLKFKAIPKRKYSHLVIAEQEPDPEGCIFEY